MSKVNGPRDNWRVIVEPDLRNKIWRRTGETTKQCEARQEDLARIACDTLVAEIRRHVDEVGSVYVESDANPVCSHCGASWTEGSDPYNGGCCDKDVAEEDARIEARATVSSSEGLSK